MSWIPKARALWRNAFERATERLEGVRRPAIRLLVAFGLMAPAALMMAGERYDARRAALEGGALVETRRFAADPVNERWTEMVLERERTYIAAGFASRFNIPLPLAEKIHMAAREYEIQPDIAFGLVRAESSFRPRAVSPVGAVGLTQVLPSTARWMVPGTTRSDLLDPEKNLRVGFQYLRYLYDKYDGNERLALTAYNRGPGTVDRHLRQGRNPDNGYVEKVLTGRSARHTALMNQRFGRRS
jgi:soluble lytic murein transglycosylase-like protein